MVIVAVVGPTASGKTDLSLDLAQKLGGAQIIGADAMARYTGMDIGTAKVAPSERRGIAHYQIDVLDPLEEASVAEYQRDARADADGILAEDDTPIYVGGSGLYLRAALDRIEFPGTDPQVRARLEACAEEVGAAAFHAQLAQVDPVAAERIESNNVRRVVRALEVIELTGRPFSANLPDFTYHKPAVQLGVRLPLEQLDERIAVRTQRMFENGLLEETRRLAEHGMGRTASGATGYAQALACLRGELTEDEAVAAVELATRQLARKQLKWFRRDPRIHWVSGLDEALEILREAGVGHGKMGVTE